MKRTIAAVALVLAILAVGYWGMAGWWQEKRELSALQSEYESARELQQALLEEKTALEGELNELREQNGDANETLQSWKVWKESLEATLRMRLLTLRLLILRLRRSSLPRHSFPA